MYWCRVWQWMLHCHASVMHWKCTYMTCLEKCCLTMYTQCACHDHVSESAVEETMLDSKYGRLNNHWCRCTGELVWEHRACNYRYVILRLLHRHDATVNHSKFVERNTCKCCAKLWMFQQLYMYWNDRRGVEAYMYMMKQPRKITVRALTK